MIIKYQSFINSNLLVVRYEGDFCIDIYKEQVLDILQKPEWKFIDKILVDLRFCKVEMTIEDLTKLADIKKNIFNKKHRSVQLVDKPMITALMHLLQTEFDENLTLDVEYCSTVEKAINLLDIKFNSSKLNNILNNLEHTF
ncbi:hypothetical protein [uncultured Lutibacter sp.]|uniref:hypothetical protein n=1 Tax=uncultured Lutibacter sp. TaxID=437739 RepID=UPI00262B9CC2|nr:hypothetical protein [uncultured Lutibacter sp.]